MQKRELKSIQVLRAFAVLLVLMFHFRFDAESLIQNSNIIFFNGSIGVDLFFVISGFIIYYVTDNKKFGFNESASFVVKRLARVVPPYSLMTFIFVYFYDNNFTNIANSLLFTPSSSQEAPFFGYPLLVVGWSLNYEIYFYLAAALGIAIFRSKRWLITLSVMAMPILFMAISGKNLSLSSHFNYELTSPYFSMISNTIIIDFMFGVLCGWLSKRESTLSDKAIISLSLASIIMFFFVYMGISRSEHGPLLWGLVSFGLVISLVELEKRGLIYLPKSLVFLGNISFSIYLTHIPILILTHYIFNTYPPTFNLEYREQCRFIAALILTLALSILYYYAIEKFACDTIRKSIFSLFATRSKKLLP